MAQYPEINSDGKIKIVRIDPNGDRSTRKPVRRTKPDKKDK